MAKNAGVKSLELIVLYEEKINSNDEVVKYKSIPKIYKDVGDFEFYEVDGVNHLRTTSILSHWVPPRLKNYFQKKFSQCFRKET